MVEVGRGSSEAGRGGGRAVRKCGEGKEGGKKEAGLVEFSTGSLQLDTELSNSEPAQGSQN